MVEHGSENHAWRLKGFFQKTFTKKKLDYLEIH
jgi:hypothetical protein